MANVSQGTTVSWAGVPLGEVVSIAVDGVSAQTVEATPRSQTTRNIIFSVADVDQGTVSVTLRGTDAMSSTCVGLTGALSIGGPSISWYASKAIFEKLGWTAAVGDLQTFTATFKVGA